MGPFRGRIPEVRAHQNYHQTVQADVPQHHRLGGLRHAVRVVQDEAHRPLGIYELAERFFDPDPQLVTCEVGDSGRVGFPLLAGFGLEQHPSGYRWFDRVLHHDATCLGMMFP